MAEHNKIGKKGEALATDYLLNTGYTICERNWRYDHKEVDIIAENKDMLIFVEVKTRSTDYFGSPEESVTQKKQQFLIEAAEEYIFINDITKEIRFDIISVLLIEDGYTINHIIEAFHPEF